MKIVPLRIFISVGSGRQYLMAYCRATRRIISFRTDYILTVKPYRKADDFDLLREKLKGMQPYMWGVSTQNRGERKETVEFTLFFDKDEQHIYKRLQREKRCGTVELLDEHHARFYAEVYDTNELRYRNKKHITQRELSARLGVTESFISSIENGLKVSLTCLDQIADVLDIHIALLISDNLPVADIKYYTQIMSIISDWPQHRIDFLKTVLCEANQILDDTE